MMVHSLKEIPRDNSIENKIQPFYVRKILLLTPSSNHSMPINCIPMLYMSCYIHTKCDKSRMDVWVDIYKINKKNKITIRYSLMMNIISRTKKRRKDSKRN